MTTSYNHNGIGTAQKPLISNEQFKALMIELGEGNSYAYEKICRTHSLENYQHTLVRYKLIENALRGK